MEDVSRLCAPDRVGFILPAQNTAKKLCKNTGFGKVLATLFCVFCDVIRSPRADMTRSNKEDRINVGSTQTAHRGLCISLDLLF